MHGATLMRLNCAHSGEAGRDLPALLGPCQQLQAVR